VWLKWDTGFSETVTRHLQKQNSDKGHKNDASMKGNEPRTRLAGLEATGFGEAKDTFRPSSDPTLKRKNGGKI